MLFSSAELVMQINRDFEPAWESVRPVPLVTIDFGNGKKITRTLNGNIATYLCTGEGNVLDAIGGLYTPDVFKDRLDQFRLLHSYVLKPPPGQTMVARLKDYHTSLAAALKEERPPDVLMALNDLGKLPVERVVKMVAANKVSKPVRNAPPTALANAEDSALWQALVDDTRQNETARRQQIHRKIAEVGPAKPQQIVKWLYKDVLHADLDDPYLGLGEALFKSYPFAAEDGKTASR